MGEMSRKAKLLEPVDLEKLNIKRDHYFPNAYIIDLPLDSVPDHVWLDIFEREWARSIHLWDRKLFVIGDKLRLLTTKHDIKDKLDWVKEVIEHTNSDIDEYNDKAQARIAQREERIGEELKKQTLSEEKEHVEMIKETIRKSFKVV
jgi:hypothetical protein